MRMRLAIVGALLVGGLTMWGVAQQPQADMPDMTKMHAQMMAEMQANDARLDALVTQMNAASGAAKVDAVAAVA